MAVNKQAIIDAVYQGAGQAAKNLIPPTMWGYNDAVQDYAYDPAKAKALLKEAGMADLFQHRPVGDAGTASLQPERAPHGGNDPGRLGQDRRESQNRDL